MPDLTMKQMLEAGTHFGHQTKRWNPKMKKYIFGARNGIYIIDLQKSLKMFNEAAKYITELASQGEKILFVGTKKQAQDLIVEEAKRCGMFYVNHRWLGGMLTNFNTIRHSIDRLKKLEEMKNNGVYDALTKKEVLKLNKEMARLEKFIGGIKDIVDLPRAIFIVDPRKEKIAFNEAKKLNIKVVAMVDTNCDPTGIDFVIPGNDDAIRSVKLIVSSIADAVLEGKGILEEKKAVLKDLKEKTEENTETKEETKSETKEKTKTKTETKKETKTESTKAKEDKVKKEVKDTGKAAEAINGGS